ncbi:MAG: hypothetical protein KDD53_06020 [Bdellovibrionales bacterium]|nr:hypothetical protein [Bdellovibrionales bacterium]
MTSISALAIANPEFTVFRQDIPSVAQLWLGDDPEAKSRYLRLVQNAGVERRFFALDPAKILSLNGMKYRSELFHQLGIPLLGSVMKEAIDNANIESSEITSVIHSSCSVPAIPSVDGAAISSIGISPRVKRIPMYQQGCAGGVVGLALASRLAKLGAPVLVTSLELCSLVFQPENHSGTELVGAALFADGAAAAVVSPESGRCSIVDTESYLLPNTRDLMGYDIFDDGFYLRLDRALPQVLSANAPSIIETFLSRHNLTRESIDYWLFHPGGIRILDFFEENLNLHAEQCHWSREVLKNYGNMSSATILFVLNEFMKSKVLAKGEHALVVGVGPGLTVELILLEGLN